MKKSTENAKKTTTEPTAKSSNAFGDLGLADKFLRATQALGYETATPIQAQAIPVVLAGRDLIGCAQTGTGKTAAFTLPMLQRLMETLPPRDEQPKPAADGRGKHGRHRKGGKGKHPKPRAIRALVLSPTRELAAQIGESLDRYGKFTPLRQTVIYGGVSQHHQVKALRHGVDALVATPGRLLDLMDQGYIDLSKIEVLVFDEADQMLDMGFLPALNRIVSMVPKKRQTLMFSATMPDAIRKLAQKWLTDPASIQVAPVATPAERIAQSVHMVDKKKKPDFLAHFLKTTPRGRTLVFSRTKHGADKIVRRLSKEGVHAAAIHGNKSQGARNRALAQFKSKRPPVLVATDIAARGLDIDSVSHVINFDLPETPETYVHRIGRTARAGAEGVAVSFCAGDEHGLLRQIERLTKRSLPVEPVVEGFEPTDKITKGAPRGGGGGGGQRRGYGGKAGGNGYGGGKGKSRRSPGGGYAKGSGGGKSRGTKSAGNSSRRRASNSSSSGESGAPAGEGAVKRKKKSQRPGKAERAKKAASKDADMKAAILAAAARKRRKRHSTSL